jgi:hypothetical protein
VQLKIVMLNISVPNPCATHLCKGMCVLIAGGTFACLCSDGAVVAEKEECPPVAVSVRTPFEK